MKLKLLLLCLVASATAFAKVNIVATLPDFGSIAEYVGGDKVKVTTIAKGTEDPHFVDARPSFIRALNQADMLIEGGADLEIGWLPPLVNGARNSKILGDAPGHVVLSKGIRLLEVPSGLVDRSMGDVHPFGNPHYWLDPENGKIMARTIANALARVDASNAKFYNAQLASFEQKIDEKIKEWEKALAPFKGSKIITYHKSWEYLATRFGLSVVGQLEPKPGFEPSPSHINTLIENSKESGVKLVLIEPFRPRKTPEYVARAIGAKLLVLPEKTRGSEEARDYVSLFDYDTRQIANALKGS